jgi:hypothetical protein
LEYVAEVRKLVEISSDKRTMAMRDAVNNVDPQLQPEFLNEIDGMCSNIEPNDFLISPGPQVISINIRKVAFQHIHSVIHIALCAMQLILFHS